ncbi:uncharacterized protein LOC133779129 [Humulus lupulus]|uniref:uncharacterized protein LOC133779129 n=1 Tax=Humulus lupulus TaxID=3486 RepID=UPI002B40F967|nr:uncharacterized protein LOC133779129 [Humulus lupulus]
MADRLVTLQIDDAEALNNVLLIGMTNRKDLLDEALLRLGRLEVQVEISLPDENGRLQILQIHTNKMKENSFLAPDVNLAELGTCIGDNLGSSSALPTTTRDTILLVHGSSLDRDITSSEFKDRALKNTTNRSKRKWESKNGSVSTPRHHIRRVMVLTSPTGQIETWRLKHYDAEKGWTDKMMELRGQHPPEELSDKEIMERVLGRDSVYLRGWGRSLSVTTSTSHRENIVGNQPTYEELVERLNDTTSRLNATNEQLSVVVDILHHNNLMAPPPPPPTDQASDANLRESPSFSVWESQDDS